MDEIFAEYIIKRKTSGKSWLYRILSILLVFLSIFGFSIFGGFSLIITSLAVYLVWYAFTITNVEYEYSVINADLIIEKIMGQRKRKRLAEYDFKEAEVMTFENSERLSRYNGMIEEVKDYSSHRGGINKVCVIFKRQNGYYELLFEPNEKVIEAIRKARPNIVKLDELPGDRRTTDTR